MLDEKISWISYAETILLIYRHITVLIPCNLCHLYFYSIIYIVFVLPYRLKPLYNFNKHLDCTCFNIHNKHFNIQWQFSVSLAVEFLVVFYFVPCFTTVLLTLLMLDLIILCTLNPSIVQWKVLAIFEKLTTLVATNAIPATCLMLLPYHQDIGKRRGSKGPPPQKDYAD